jgi:hypothetical protein
MRTHPGSAVMNATSTASNRSLRTVEQQPSHSYLSKEVSRSSASPMGSTRARLDAIIVPASRRAAYLQAAINLAAYLGVMLVVLCSKKTNVEQVAKRVARTPGARSLIVPISDEWKHPGFPTRTSAAEFQDANGNRESDVSAKRNLGLLLARLHGWNKIAFVDDDVTDTGDLGRLAAYLEQHQVAGMQVRRYPDNSVVCHARRLAGFGQDVFVTGAVLGVHCNSLPLSFFPDIYNEDWFFFAKEAAARSLPQVGEAKQTEYDPFATPDRARQEEFGDLLAEGLYALIGEEDPSVPFDEQLRAATEAYWSRFIEARRHVLVQTTTRLFGFLDRNWHDGRVSSALASLAAAEGQLDHTITADLCVRFLAAWQEDLYEWQRFSTCVNNVGSTREAMDFLQLKTWTLVDFGGAPVNRQTTGGRLVAL